VAPAGAGAAGLFFDRKSKIPISLSCFIDFETQPRLYTALTIIPNLTERDSVALPESATI
jgi:hypothetical protein